MLLARLKDTAADRTLKNLGAQRFIETSGRDFRLVTEHARGTILNLRIREDAHLK